MIPNMRHYAQQFFVHIFTTNWVWHATTFGVQSIFFWYSYITIVQQNGILRTDVSDPARFVSSSIFTPNTPANPLNYTHYFWLCLALLIGIYATAIYLKDHAYGKTTTLLFWLAWGVQLVLAIGVLPLFVGAVGI